MTEIATQRAYAIPHNRHKTDVDMKRFGGSITALEISGIMKSLDYVCSMEGGHTISDHDEGYENLFSVLG